MQLPRLKTSRAHAGNVRAQPAGVLADDHKIAMHKEIEDAKKEWLTCVRKFDYALDKDQIDYAIYAIEAAEHRYNMLLREAKRMKLSLLDESTGRPIRGLGLE